MSGPIGASPWMYGIEPIFYDYKIDQSLRFNSADSAYLSRTPSSAGNQRLWTFSAWVKKSVLDVDSYVLGVNTSSAPEFIKISNSSTDQFEYAYWNGSVYVYQVRATAELRDTSSWYHVVLVVDTAQGTAANRVKFYVNGTQLTTFSISTYPTQNADTRVNAAVDHRIGSGIGNAYYDGYMAEVNFIDGAAVTPASFGETKNGIWIPKEYSGSYGTNGFYCKFVSGAVGTDSSGNGNNFTHTPGNASRNRPVQDSPTNNFNVIPFTNTSLLTHEHQGMRINTARTGHWDGIAGSFSVKSGKWYHEVQLNVGSGDLFRSVPGWKQEPEESEKVFNRLGASGDPFGTGTGDLGNTGHYAYQSWSTQFFGNGGYTGTSIAASSGDVINVAVDFDNNKIYFGKNGTYIANDGGTDGDPANGTNESLSGLYSTGKYYSPCVSLRSDNTAGSNSARFNFGSDRSFGANLALGTAYADENGYGEFRYAVPDGFLALCSQNLPEPVIGPLSDTQADDHFNTVLYSGTGSSNSITGVGFQPAWVWGKRRNATGNHWLHDVVRGATKGLHSDSVSNEYTDATVLSAFNSDGFTVGSHAISNSSGGTYVSWNWKAGGAAVSNSGGTITSSVSAGEYMSICTWTGNGTSGATIGHGLGKIPSMIIVKRRNANNGWAVYHEKLGTGKEVYLNMSQAETSSNFWITSPTTSVFSVSAADYVNTSGDTFVGYAFANLEGACKAGSYVGNANADGPFIRTGFRPAWIMQKKINNTGHWHIWDSTRNTSNEVTKYLLANETNTEYTDGGLDIVSNGFKPRKTGTGLNASGDTYIYLAFAEQPFKYANAR